MEAEKRRGAILELLKKNTMPLSGTSLAKQLGVSRQVIVQDVALIRASGFDILATARGYILNKESDEMKKRIILVRHTAQELEDELNTIIDNGGMVRDVIINHPVYGELVGALMLRTRREILQFVKKVEEANTYPLLKLTDGIHMHTVQAMTDEELDVIEEELRKKGYLYQNTSMPDAL